MKVIQTVTEVSGEGLEALMGKKVTLFCANYFYTGKLIGVNTTCVKLEDAAIIYETGSFADSNYKDVQPLHTKEFYVQIGAIESFGVLK
jgi:hypothetical protein